MSVFADLVGQEAAVAELRRAAEAARQIAGEDVASGELGNAAMSHAWLITGPPGSGRSLAARAFAAALQCTEAEPGAGECAQCKAVMGNNHPDVTALTTDLVTIKADDVRAYVASSYQAPSSGNWRVFIIEDADRMLPRTTNVLLKAIEEPGPRTVWILCTAAVADVLPTIRSRTRNVNLVTPSADDVARLLVEREGVTEEKARVAAQAAQSHIGVAKALATDPQAGELRRKTLDAVVGIKTTGDAVLAAMELTDMEAMRGEAGAEADEEAIEREVEERLAAMGLEAGARVPAAVRSQVKAAGVDSKRRATRTMQDTVDRELTYIMSLYRDVLVTQLDAQVDLINADYREAIERIAVGTTSSLTLERIDAIATARQRLRGNVAVQLLMEAALVELRAR
ncbi:DNA polymerase III subunit delta' [Trueperella bialowiezensis]|uniref:DNA polymerase III subunit delta' n=1 Tax=Trueperella bialowiezensis TaxID=312285 RepID=A0A3S4V6L4_9ACTO|nr:DNA polymerase III subunit delta' [Trueperella bialowiezensis]VEI13145.1 DNA polymerase III subunit tau [Trueperella bialowiezensis]